jgi:hypothetical protein
MHTFSALNLPQLYVANQHGSADQILMTQVQLDSAIIWQYIMITGTQISQCLYTSEYIILKKH